VKILSVNKNIEYGAISIVNISEDILIDRFDIETFDYIIVSGGDGTVRRVVKILQSLNCYIPIILNPTGSFNVVAKLHNVPPLDLVLNSLVQKNTLVTKTINYYSLNEEVFLFSAGNMGDLQHIFLSETFRFSILKKGMAKYILALLFLFPMHLVMTPFMLLSSRKFFIFTPTYFMPKIGSFRSKVSKPFAIDLKNRYNLIELDGDLVTINDSILNIKVAGVVELVTKIV